MEDILLNTTYNVSRETYNPIYCEKIRETFQEQKRETNAKLSWRKVNKKRHTQHIVFANMNTVIRRKKISKYSNHYTNFNLKTLSIF